MVRRQSGRWQPAPSLAYIGGVADRTSPSRQAARPGTPPRRPRIGWPP